MANAQPTPRVPISTPLMLGPTSPPSWKTVEFRLTALRINAAPTSSPTKLCRVGLSTTTTSPSAKRQDPDAARR